MLLKSLKIISLLWLGSIGSAFFTFAFQVISARHFGADNFGIFSSSLGLITILGCLIGFGVSQFWLKAFGEDGWDAYKWIRPSFLFFLLSTTIIIIILFIWSIFFIQNQKEKIVTYILIFHLISIPILELVSSKLQIEERYYELGFWQSLPSIFRFLLLASLITTQTTTNIINLAACYIGSSIFIIYFGSKSLYKLYRKDFKLANYSTTTSTSQKNISELIIESWPFGAATLFYLIYFQSSIILINQYLGSESAGYYSAAFNLLAALYLLPGAIYQKFLMPKIHRWSAFNPEKIYKLYITGNKIMLAIGIVSAIFIILLGNKAIEIIFGKQYLPASIVLITLSISIPFRFLASNLAAILTTNNYLKPRIKIMFVAAVINILANVLLIPKFGISGAAWATIASEIFLCTAYLLICKKYMNIVKVKMT